MKTEQKMFVVGMWTGQYEDATCEVVGYADDRIKAQNYVDKMTAIYESMDKKVDSFYRNELKVWDATHTADDSSSKALVAIPIWNSWETVTDEMRQKRNADREHNRKIQDGAAQERLKVAQVRLAFINQWLREHLTDDEYAMYEKRDSNYWTIWEDIPML